LFIPKLFAGGALIPGLLLPEKYEATHVLIILGMV
jgi:hypothetical protein